MDIMMYNGQMDGYRDMDGYMVMWMDGQIYGWMENGWMIGYLDGWSVLISYGQMDQWIDEWKFRWIEDWMQKIQMDIYIYKSNSFENLLVGIYSLKCRMPFKI